MEEDLQFRAGPKHSSLDHNSCLEMKMKISGPVISGYSSQDIVSQKEKEHDSIILQKARL